ncbi:hypothetical protein [Parvicella tangerina]|uniref:DUF3352 domain-containing protein n=1 Tax=Parvicella tangerina TaxID=2829795 RepID=A0A916JM26_9FLAO|nr:hypothetical protein [Parvicella tangerina]CAG5080776.1 hypothetical protein CRYO30217_01441 [Parvicella tangerina]
MKFEKIKILYWSFWPILLLFVLGGYYFVPKVNDQSHLEVIPADVDAVILVNPIALFAAYERLLEDNPVALKEMESIKETGAEMDPSIGINPLKKVGIAHYKRNDEEQGFVVVVQLTNFKEFVKNANRRDNKPDPVNYADGKYILVEKDDQVFLKKGTIGILYQAQRGSVSKELAETLYHEFYENEKSLMQSEPSFLEAVNGKSQFSYWSINTSNLAENLNPHIAAINNLFNRKKVSLNIAENGLNTNGSMELKSESSIRIRDEEEVELIGNECFRFAASVDPDEFKGFFDIVLSEDKKYLISSWNGGVCASINGFKDVELKKVNITPSNDPLYPFNYDTVGVLSAGISNFAGKFENQFSYPFFTVACELDDVEGLKEQLAADSTITEVSGYYAYTLDNYFVKKKIPSGIFGNEIVLEPQRICFYFIDNSIVFSPELPEVDFVPQYATFHLKFDFQKFFETYTPKNMFDDLIMSQVSKYNFGAYEVNFKEIKDGHIFLEGNFNLTETKNHFIGFPLLINRLRSLASLPLL